MMNGDETRKYEMLARVREFGVSHAAAFAPGTFGADLLAQIAAAVDQLSSYSAAQATGTGTVRAGTATRKLARETLRDDLELMRRTAKAISVRRPGTLEKFRLPPLGRDQGLLDAARAFAAEAAPLRADFALHEMGDAFFATLEAHIAAFEQSLTMQRRGREARVTATAAIDGAIAAGVGAVRQLDSIVHNKFAADEVALTAWKNATRLRRLPRAPRAPQPEPAETPAGP
jgi:hypothetical protein